MQTDFDMARHHHGPHHGEEGHISPPDDGLIPPLKIFQVLTQRGETVLWVVFALMTIATLVFFLMGTRVAKNSRVFYQLTGAITAVSAISYYAMAVQVGVFDQYLGHHTFRQLYWARYVEWLITTPLIILDLSFLSGLSPLDTILAIFADIGMVLTLAFAALTPYERFKWGFFAFSGVFFLYVMYTLVFPARQFAAQKSNSLASFYTSLSLFAIVVWVLYPVAWGFSDSGRKLTVDQEIYFYAVLDVLSKAVFGAWLLFGHEKIPEAKFKLGSFWTNGNGVGGDYEPVDEEA